MPTLRSAVLSLALVALAAAAVGPTDAFAQKPNMEGVMGARPASTRLGGHIGFVVPSWRRAQGETTYLTDRFIFGFPVGLTVKPRGPVAVDFEFIPTFNTGDDFVLTIHPGVLYGFAKHYAIGVRAAYDAGSANDNYGITPLIARGFALTKKTGWFLEIDVPIRRQNPELGDSFTSVAVAGHIGITF